MTQEVDFNQLLIEALNKLTNDESISEFIAKNRNKILNIFQDSDTNERCWEKGKRRPMEQWLQVRDADGFLLYEWWENPHYKGTNKRMDPGIYLDWLHETGKEDPDRAWLKHPTEGWDENPYYKGPDQDCPED